MKEKKKVLIITYYWPPSGGAGVQRWLKFAKYLPEFGWQPVIYTPENPEAPINDESLSKDIHPEVQVIKKPIWEPYIWYKRFTGKDKNQRINAGFLQEKKSNLFLENISVFIRGNLFIPDARMFWIKPSVKFLIKYLKENHIDVVISTGPPHSMHLIALKLKKGLSVKWIADFRDPWTNIDFYKDLKLTRRSDQKHKRLEQEVLKNADIVVSVSKTWGEEYKNMGAKKVEIITNGFDYDDLPISKPQPYKDYSIIHTGALNKDRNHNIFWKAIKELIQESKEFEEKIKIKFVGKIDTSIYKQINEYNLSRYFEHISQIPHNEIVNMLMKAHVLYLPINNTPNAKGIIPGKIFEYIAAQRPVLVIGRTDGDIGEIINETESGKVYGFNDLEGVKEFLVTNFYKFQAKEYNSLSQDIKKFSRRYLTQKLVNLINAL
ncbi:MAG: glycosyltransferase [Thiohalospira sp.]